ncbi:MAG: hypothetical protein ACLTG4_06275 [Oscillospiraceae bacterium]
MMIRNGRWPKQDLWNLLPVIIVLLLGAAYFAIMGRLHPQPHPAQSRR